MWVMPTDMAFFFSLHKDNTFSGDSKRKRLPEDLTPDVTEMI